MNKRIQKTREASRGFLLLGIFVMLLLAGRANAQKLAYASAVVTNGFVVAITVVDGGQGYVTQPSVYITGGGGNSATATATVSNGAVISIRVTSAGLGYTSIPQVTIAPPPNYVEMAVQVLNIVSDEGNKVNIEWNDVQGTTNGWHSLATNVAMTNGMILYDLQAGPKRRYYRLTPVVTTNKTAWNERALLKLAKVR